MGELGEKVKEEEERREKGEKERDSVIITLQEKVCHTYITHLDFSSSIEYISQSV